MKNEEAAGRPKSIAAGRHRSGGLRFPGGPGRIPLPGPLDRPPSCSPPEADLDIRRRARIENHIARIKDSGGQRFPFQPFRGNQAWLLTVVLAYTLVLWFQTICLGGAGLRRARPKTMRWAYRRRPRPDHPPRPAAPPANTPMPALTTAKQPPVLPQITQLPLNRPNHPHPSPQTGSTPPNQNTMKNRS